MNCPPPLPPSCILTPPSTLSCPQSVPFCSPPSQPCPQPLLTCPQPFAFCPQSILFYSSLLPLPPPGGHRHPFSYLGNPKGRWFWPSGNSPPPGGLCACFSSRKRRKNGSSPPPQFDTTCFLLPFGFPLFASPFFGVVTVPRAATGPSHQPKTAF